MYKEAVLGIDIGTTGTKTIAMDREGHILAQAYCAYPLNTPRDKYVEQDARDWLRTAVQTVREVTAQLAEDRRVTALCLSTQAGSTVPLDESGEPLRPAMVWMDGRGYKEIEPIRALRDKKTWQETCGCAPSPLNSAAHLAWIKANEPDIFQKAAYFATTPDYMNLHLTGKHVIDHTNAALTAFHDLSGRWDPLVMEVLGLGEHRMPAFATGGALVGTLTPAAAELFGLDTDVRVYNSGHDQYCAAVGTGTVDPGAVMLSAGTAWVLFCASPTPVFDENRMLSTCTHFTPGAYGAFGVLSLGGVLLKWFRQQFADEDYDSICQIAAERVGKNPNAFFYPYHGGGNAPENDKTLRGVWSGIALDTDKYDMALALMEGLAFEAATVVDIFRKSGCPAERLNFTGGGANSDLWTNILAAVLDMPVCRPPFTESACVGAAAMAAVGEGWYKDLHGWGGALSDAGRWTQPDPDLVTYYREKYRRYLQLRPHAIALGRQPE